jgi:hypothetical protein
MIRKLYASLALCIALPAAAASGGPDTYGYIWRDSNEPNGPAFSWIDIVGVGQQVTGLGDDNVVGPFVMATNFEYYWYNRKFMWVGSNGYIAFMNGNIASPFPAIPTAGGTEDYIAGLMGDLNFTGAGNPGQCWLYDDLTTTIVSYINVPFWMPNAPNWTGANTFQIILSKVDSTVTIQYLQQTGFTQSNDLKVGIESMAGTIGLQHSSNTYPVANYAVRFYRPAASTLPVIDAAVNWTGAPGTGGRFLSRGGVPIGLSANVANIGNQGIAGYSVTGAVLNAGGATVVSSTQAVGAQVPGLDATVDFPITFNPSATGTYRFDATISGVANELITANNVRTQELVVVDSTAATHDLRFNGTTDDGVGIGWNGGNGGVGVHLVPPYYPAYATHATARIASNLGNAPFCIRVYADNGANGAPGTLLDSVYVPAAQGAAGDHVYPLTAPITITQGGVYVQWYMLGPNVNIAVDIVPPFSLQTYEVIDGTWAEYRSRTEQDFHLGLRLAIIPIHDIGCTGFFGLADGQGIGSPTAIRAYVKNLGNQPESAFQVRYRFGNGPVSGQAYSGAPLNPGQQTLITFSSYFVPSADAADRLCAWTVMTGDASAANDTACVSIETYVGIDERSAALLRVAPNPADASLRLEQLPAGRWTLRVADAAGRTVQEQRALAGLQPWVLPTEALAEGTYQLLLLDEAHTGAEPVRARFVVRH